MFKSRPGRRSENIKRIINLPATGLRTLGHYWSKVSSKGQVTIPASVRNSVGIRSGQDVTFTPLGNGKIIVRTKSGTLADVRGIVKTKRERADRQNARWHRLDEVSAWLHQYEEARRPFVTLDQDAAELPGAELLQA